MAYRTKAAYYWWNEYIYEKIFRMNSFVLLIKSIAGMLFLLCCMAAMLFLPFAGFDYILAWYYLASFFIPVVVITIYIFKSDKNLLKSRLSAGATAEQRISQKIIQSFASISFIAVYIVSSFDYSNHWCKMPFSLSLGALVLVILSFVFLFFVFKQNSFLSATIEVQSEQKVISSGLYGIVRHPMYSGASVLMLATPIALGSFWGLIPSVLLVVVIYIRALDEEKELLNNLEGYAEYRKKVKYRIIPFVL